MNAQISNRLISIGSSKSLLIYQTPLPSVFSPPPFSYTVFVKSSPIAFPKDWILPVASCGRVD